MSKSKWLRQKIVLEYHFVLKGDSGPKWAYVLNNDFGKPQN